MLKLLKSKLDTIAFFIRNVLAAGKVANFNQESTPDLLFRGYLSSDEEAISELYKKLNDGILFSRLQRKLYSQIGSRFMLIVEKKEQTNRPKVVGMNIYYVNKRDIQENTIHEGFIGVAPGVGGQGIATTMRRMAAAHFKSAGFSGISTRISLNNMPSLKSAEKVGFQIVEEYVDPSTGQPRVYMVCKF